MAATFIDKEFETSVAEVSQAITASREVTQNEPEIPAGYLPIKLSTKGKFGVPEVVYVRNFSTEDLLDLSMSVDSNLPTKTIQALNRVILDKNVNVKNWPEKAVTELLLSIYSNFFTPRLTSIPFPWDETDIEYLVSRGLEEKAAALKSGAWEPKIDINLLRDIEITSIDPEIKDTIVISKKDGSFHASFSYPKIGDLLVLDEALNKEFASKDSEWLRFEQKIELRERLIEEGQVEKASTIVIDTQTYASYLEYKAQRARLAIKLTQALYLKSFMGQDVSNLPLVDKLKFFEDPRMDVKVTKKIEDQYAKIQFGVRDMIKVKNPITGEPCERRFTFRTVDILQAIREYDASDYDIGYDD